MVLSMLVEVMMEEIILDQLKDLIQDNMHGPESMVLLVGISLSFKFDLVRYALGGYDGDTMVSSVEVFDPRIDSWMMVEPMKASRGCFGSFVLGGRIYVTGGLQDTQVLDQVLPQARETNEGH
ncbi:kelch-like protein 18 isoform X4 [Salvia splendens]|uniref:kelch-like protein 18 isoform X4 n=1 Tax=Salvia splendens TaxID=180675 RepID=UPI001C25B736|nr:kelch-like protein 18 isoform X4 [Salvia splendens]